MLDCYLPTPAMVFSQKGRLQNVSMNDLGDSGGPLLAPDKPDDKLADGDPALDLIVGIVSYGPKKCDGSKAGVYTNVGFFYFWIKDVIRGREKQVLNNTFLE